MHQSGHRHFWCESSDYASAHCHGVFASCQACIDSCVFLIEEGQQEEDAGSAEYYGSDDDLSKQDDRLSEDDTQFGVTKRNEPQLQEQEWLSEGPPPL